MENLICLAVELQEYCASAPRTAAYTGAKLKAASNQPRTYTTPSASPWNESQTIEVVLAAGERFRGGYNL